MSDQSKNELQVITCLRCGGTMFQARIKADSSIRNLTFYQFALEPLDKGMLDERQSYVVPMVCRNCGFVEFFVQNPEELEGTGKASNAAPWTNG